MANSIPTFYPKRITASSLRDTLGSEVLARLVGFEVDATFHIIAGLNRM